MSKASYYCSWVILIVCQSAREPADWTQYSVWKTKLNPEKRKQNKKYIWERILTWMLESPRTPLVLRRNILECFTSLFCVCVLQPHELSTSSPWSRRNVLRRGSRSIRSSGKRIPAFLGGVPGSRGGRRGRRSPWACEWPGPSRAQIRTRCASACPRGLRAPRTVDRSRLAQRDVVGARDFAERRSSDPPRAAGPVPRVRHRAVNAPRSPGIQHTPSGPAVAWKGDYR